MKHPYTLTGSILLSLSLALMTGCSNTSTKTDYNPTVDFSTFKQYTWQDDNAAERISSGLMSARIKHAIGQHFSERNIPFNANAHYAIRYHLHTQQDKAASLNNRSAIGIGGGSGNVGVSISLPIGSNKPVEFEQMTIDIIDSRDQSLVWRGVDSFKQAKNSPEKNTKRVQATVNAILSQFPPAKE